MAPKVRMRRPAAAPVVRRRPAGQEEADVEAEKKCRDLGALEIARLGTVWLRKAVYYGRELDLAGRFKSLKVEAGQPYGVLQVSGTKDEALLRSLTGKEDREVLVHLCDERCEAVLTEEFLVHGELC